MAKDFPIKSKAKGWRFRITEESAGSYTIEGRDVRGREIAFQGSDPDVLLAKANSAAIEISDNKSSGAS